MKKTMRFLSLAALALVGAVMTGCSNEDDLTVEPENKSNVVTLTTTVGIGGGAETRALAADGTKTFAVGETMAVIYKNTSGTTVKAVSAALAAGDIQSGNKTATFTFTLEDPGKGQDVTYIYPAAMAGETDVDYSNLNSQDGTLATLSSDLDLATYSGAWDGASLPSATLTNQLAFLAVTLKDADGSNDITSSITEMTISDGTNTYTVSPSSLSTIYVAIQPTASANIEVTATDGSTNYTKSLTGKTYEAGNGYNVSWRMTLPACSYTAPTLVGSTLTYNGSGQALVTAGSATGGTIYYRYDYTPNTGSASSSEWSTTVPAPTNAGTYTVYYKVEAAEGYTGGVESTSLGSKVINKANGWVTLSPSSGTGFVSFSSPDYTVNVNSHGGSLSYNISGSYPEYVSAQVKSGTQVRIWKNNTMAVGYGTIVTITSAATNNYNAASANFSCNQ